jgi:hypothetical protein
MNYNAIISPSEFAQLFPIESDGIPAGEVTSFEFENIEKFYTIWTLRIEKLIKLAKDTKGDYTQRLGHLAKIRGFTYEEYAALFNSFIAPENFPFYPIFGILGAKKGGISTEKQRADFTHKYQHDEDCYIQCLLENGAKDVLSFFFGGRLKAYLPLPKLKMHSYIVAPTGSGKSELIRAIFYELQKKYDKFSFVLIDPHGDLAKKVKRFHLNIDKERVIYIDPFLKDGFSPTFNVFDVGEKSIKNLSHTAEQIIISFEEVLSREGGELSESMVNMLEKSIYFLLERDGSTLLDLADLLNAQPDILQEAIEYSEYFNERFLRTEKRSRDALLYRIERLLNSPALKPLVAGQSTFSLEKSLNSGKVIIFNLGELGEMTQAAFGKFLVANIKSLVRKRDPEKSLPTFVFIDECQNLVSGSFEYILSQLRKYGLHLILANQYVNQLGDQVEAVKKNTAIKIVGGDEADDIKAMIPLSKDQISLKDYEYYLKIRGRTVLKIKSPSFLINNPTFEMTSQEEQIFDNYQLSKYYKVSGQTKVERVPRKEGDPASPPSNQSNKPPFDLFLGHDGDSTNQ